ncbi:MAG TPA: pyridoxamine 5'-phosphate oxidase [Thermomicrobiales bacterium]|jgi:pyridoxamine 5'-phosphate oxidase
MTGTPDAPPSPESIRRLRKEYALAGLSEVDAAPDPFLQFRRWFDEALQAELREPNAMTVATATREGVPSARIVLLKSWDERGFVFYTNYEGQKGRELAENPAAALVFYWSEMERQVRIAGAVARVSPEESDRYFASRPLGSRLGAIVSEQSRVIPNRQSLEARLQQLEAEYQETLPTRPTGWGGYRVTPQTVEFWQGRPNRLHDRLRYRRDAAGAWIVERLAP